MGCWNIHLFIQIPKGTSKHKETLAQEILHVQTARSWKRFWRSISVFHPASVHAFVLTFFFTLVNVVKPPQLLAWILQFWTGIIPRMSPPVGFGRRWHCHSPGSEGCWVLIFVEERHHKNLWRIWFHFQSNLNSAQQIQPGTTHRDPESNSSFSPFKAKASWEKYFLKLDPATL